MDILRRKELAERNWCRELPNGKHEAGLLKLPDKGRVVGHASKLYVFHKLCEICL
jgi:hypothetical protein